MAVMLWPEGMELAATGGMPMVCIRPGSSTLNGLACANRDFKPGESKDPIKKHFKLKAVPWRLKRVKTSMSKSAAPPSPNWVRKDQTGSMPVMA